MPNVTPEFNALQWHAVFWYNSQVGRHPRSYRRRIAHDDNLLSVAERKDDEANVADFGSVGDGYGLRDRGD